jgi:hypothetical protein
MDFFSHYKEKFLLIK